MSLAMDTPSLVIVGAPHFFLQHDVAAFGAERDAYCISQLVHATLEGAASDFVESNEFGHSV